MEQVSFWPETVVKVRWMVKVIKDMNERYSSEIDFRNISKR